MDERPYNLIFANNDLLTCQIRDRKKYEINFYQEIKFKPVKKNHPYWRINILGGGIKVIKFFTGIRIIVRD